MRLTNVLRKVPALKGKRPKGGKLRRPIRRELRVESLENRWLLTAVPALALDLQTDTGTPDDNITTEAVIVGSITDIPDYEWVAVEIDEDGDGAADRSLPLRGDREFTADLGDSLPHGEQTIQARAGYWSRASDAYVFGSWESKTFTYEPAPVINSLESDGDGVVSGNLTANDVDQAVIEFDYDNDGAVDFVAETDESGGFYKDMSDLPAGLYTVAVRAVEDDENGNEVEGEWLKVEIAIPEMVTFGIDYNGNGEYRLFGHVNYEFADDLTVSFGGILDGLELTAEVDSDGDFFLDIDIEGVIGYITATASGIDPFGDHIVSNTLRAWFPPTA